MRREEAPDERRRRDRLRGWVEERQHALAARPGMPAALDEVVGDLGTAAAGAVVGELHQRRRLGELRIAGAAVGAGRLKGSEALPAKVRLTVGGIELSVEVEGLIELE